MDKPLSGKTFLLSQAFILLIGLAILGLFYYLLNIHSTTNSRGNYQGPVTTTPTSLTLDLISPDDDLLAFEKSVLVSGKTSPNSPVLISSLDKDEAFQSKADGSFSFLFDLNLGVNELIIKVFDSKGEQKETIRTIYYSKEKI